MTGFFLTCVGLVVILAALGVLMARRDLDASDEARALDEELAELTSVPPWRAAGAAMASNESAYEANLKRRFPIASATAGWQATSTEAANRPAAECETAIKLPGSMTMAQHAWLNAQLSEQASDARDPFAMWDGQKFVPAVPSVALWRGTGGDRA